MGLGGSERTRHNDLFGIQRQLWPKERPVWTGINYQSVYSRGGKITKAVRAVLTNNLGDPVNECTRTNAFGFDTGHCWNSWVHLITRLVCLCLLNHLCCHFSCIKLLHGQLCPCKLSGYFTLCQQITFFWKMNFFTGPICTFSNNVIIARAYGKQSHLENMYSVKCWGNVFSWTGHNKWTHNELQAQLYKDHEHALWGRNYISHLELFKTVRW